MRAGSEPRAALPGRVLLVLGVLTALSPLSMDIYTPSLPAIQAELGGGEWVTQASITACLAGIGVGQLLWGPLSDRHGRRAVILAGMAGWTLASVASAYADSPGWLIIARGLAGLAGAAGIVAARAVLTDLSNSPSAVASRIGVLAMASTLAPILSPLLGSVIAGLWGWRADFVALTVIGLATIAAFAVLVPETLPPHRRTRSGGAIFQALGTAVRTAELPWVALALALHSFGFYAYITTASFVVERQFGFAPWVFGLAFGTNALVVLTFNAVFRRIVRSRPPAYPLGLGLIVCTLSGAAMLAASGLGAGPIVVWATSLSYAAGVGLVFPGAHAWGQLTPAARGAASALTGSAQFLGGVLGSPVTGLIGPTATSLGAVIVLGSGAALMAWRVARARARAGARE